MYVSRQCKLFTAVASLLLATPLWATNGYFTHGTGTKNKGMAGAGLAMPEDAISIANNPAAALANTGKYDLGIAVFSPLRHYKTTGGSAGQGGTFTIGPNDIDSDNNYHFIPHMAGAWQINDKSAWAAAFYGKGGMNTDWKGGTATFIPPGSPQPVTAPGTYGAGIFGGTGGTGVDLSQAFLDITYARSAGDSFTWGVSLVGVMQVFAARGLATFAGFTESAALGEPVENLTNNGHDQSYGIAGKFGFQWQASEKVSFAASYQSKVKMSKLDDYSDLFAKNGTMDIPADLKVGITFRPNPGLALNFDVEQIWYNDVAAVGNPFSNLFTGCLAGDSDYCLGGKKGAGFGWDNMTVYKIGGQWSSANDWTWRAGFSHADQPIPDSEVMFNILAPATIENHITFGFTKGLSSGNEWSMSFLYALNKKVSGINPLDPNQQISIDMDQWEIEFGFGWR